MALKWLNMSSDAGDPCHWRWIDLLSKPGQDDDTTGMVVLWQVLLPGVVAMQGGTPSGRLLYPWKKGDQIPTKTGCKSVCPCLGPADYSIWATRDRLQPHVRRIPRESRFAVGMQQRPPG